MIVDKTKVREEIQDRCKCDEPISLEEYQNMRMNSYERAYIVPYLSTEALLSLYDNTSKNISMREPIGCATTYEEAMLFLVAPEMAQRLRSS